MEEAKTMKTPMSSSIKLDKDEKGKSIDFTIDTFHFLGHLLVSWHIKTLTALTKRSTGLGPVDCCEHFSLYQPLLPCFFFHMAPRRESATSRVQGKHPTESSQSKARRKVRFDIALFSSMEDCQRATYGMGGTIISTVGGVEIYLDLESICHIFDIAPVGLKVYESKMWPIVPGFELREVIQRICELPDAQGMSKPSAHSLTVINRMLHHILCSIFLPQSGH
ncbi:hypothetical protein AAG906_017050 [Vitis piasezkii]